MSQIHFYSDKDDLATVLRSVESTMAVKYVMAGSYLDDCFNIFESYELLPNLGIATSDATVSCTSYLILPLQTPLVPEEVPLLPPPRGNPHVDQMIAALPQNLLRPPGEKLRNRFRINQLRNPDSITFTPGGMWAENVLLAGNLGTCSRSQVSLDLMSHFRRAFRKTCTKHGLYFVGPHALKMLQCGKRLTMAVQSPAEYDLA